MAQIYCTMKIEADSENLPGYTLSDSECSNIPCHGHDILETLVKSVSVKRLKFIDDFINLVSGFNCILCWSYFNVHAWIVHWSVRQSDGIFNAWYVHSLKAEILCYKLRRLGYKYISFDGLQVWNFHLTQKFIPYYDEILFRVTYEQKS
jgi:hypothetical protein